MILGVALWSLTILMARLLTQSWISPGSVAAAALGGTSLLQPLLAPEYYSSLSATLFMVVAVWLAIVGGLAGVSVRLGERARPFEPAAFEISRPNRALAIGYAAGAVSLGLTMKEVGATASTFGSASQLMAVAQAATQLRYTAGLDFPIAYNLSNAVVLSYVVVVAAHFAAKRRVEIRMLGPVVLFILSNLLITTRAPLVFLLLMVVFTVGYFARPGFVSAQLWSGQSVRRLMLGGTIAAVAFGALVVYFQALRFGAGNERDAAAMWMHLRRWPFGSVSAFAMWLDGFAAAPDPRPPGFYTFMGIYDNLGISTRQLGVYGDYVYLTAGESENVYTAFRGLIHDFGIAGAGLTFCAIAFVAGVAMRGRLLSGHVGLSVFVGTYAFIACTVFVSFWSYTSNLVALALAPALFRLSSPAGVAGREVIRS